MFNGLLALRFSSMSLTGSYMEDKPNFALLLPQLYILLPDKFLQFDWLRAAVFQPDLKYLHVKIAVTMVTKITK